MEHGANCVYAKPYKKSITYETKINISGNLFPALTVRLSVFVSYH